MIALTTVLNYSSVECWKSYTDRVVVHSLQNNLEEARTQIDAIAWYINDQIKEHEHSLMMIYIQKSLQGECGHLNLNGLLREIFEDWH